MGHLKARVINDEVVNCDDIDVDTAVDIVAVGIAVARLADSSFDFLQSVKKPQRLDIDVKHHFRHHVEILVGRFISPRLTDENRRNDNIGNMVKTAYVIDCATDIVSPLADIRPYADKCRSACFH